MASLLDQINQEQDKLLASFGLDAGTGVVDSPTGAIPVRSDVMNDQPQNPPEPSPLQGMALNEGWLAKPPGGQPAAPVAASPASKDGAVWEPGVGFVQKKNAGNAGQEWAAAAGSPAPNLAAIQRHNESMLDPNARNQQGGPGNTPSTQRYYTRKLARAIFMSNSGPEARAQAHMDLRFQGAPASAPTRTSDEAWNSMFAQNENNNYGEGTPARTGQKLVNEPGGGSRFRYLTELT